MRIVEIEALTYFPAGDVYELGKEEKLPLRVPIGGVNTNRNTEKKPLKECSSQKPGNAYSIIDGSIPSRQFLLGEPLSSFFMPTY